ncbi:MAG: class I SAM-dependent methyltransferase [Pseudomonadota bacterium]
MALEGACESDIARGRESARSLGITLDTNARWQLFHEGERCRLIDREPNRRQNLGELEIDWTSGRAAHRRIYGGGRGQALARAVGLKPGINPALVDATGGLGRDAFVLATLGCRVTLIERSPVVFCLLDSAHRRALSDPQTRDIAQRIELVCADARHWLDQTTSPAEVVYLDPMYPHRDKTALVKKEMRLFRELVGDDGDADALLDAALACDIARAVVKRPKTAEPLGSVPPGATVSSKNTRYDLYPKRKIQPTETP